jgi:hypothetical protein
MVAHKNENEWKRSPDCRILGPVAAIMIALFITTIWGCSRSSFPGDQEEVHTDTDDVPSEVLAAAEKYCDRLGKVRIKEWFWDTEDECWECTIVGLSRRAELDIEPDGTFSELELVFEMSEVEKILPEVAKVIQEKSRNDPHVFIELSLRREAYLDDIPDLKKAWSLSGIVLEFQCSNGRDFEIDARGMQIKKKVDDTSDPGIGETPL